MHFSVFFVAVTMICLPEVASNYVRKSRAFKSYNFDRVPYKRAGYEDEVGGAPAGNVHLLQSLMTGNGVVSVEEMAEGLASNPSLALDFVLTYMDTDGDGFITAKELPTLSRRL